MHTICFTLKRIPVSNRRENLCGFYLNYLVNTCTLVYQYLFCYGFGFLDYFFWDHTYYAAVLVFSFCHFRRSFKRVSILDYLFKHSLLMASVV
ncbi:hypothetical protein V1511DRAFT_499144 [Dipodascopsis uninucleata]